MINTQTLTDFPLFADAGEKRKPEDSKYSAGFIPADVLPAEWLNWFLNKSSDGITKINQGLLSVEKELNNILQATNITPDGEAYNQVLNAIKLLSVASAAKLTTPRNITIKDKEDVNAGTPVPFDGSGDIAINLPETIAANITGTASYAQTLKTPRNIEGQSFDGSASIAHYGLCDTEAVTIAKVSFISGLSLVTGAKIYVKFSNGNAANEPTLNVNNTGAKLITMDGTAVDTGCFDAGGVYEFVYDGTNWECVSGMIRAKATGDNSGYVKYRNGLLVQFGAFYLGTTVGTLTLPLAFSVWNSYALVTGEVQHANNSNDTEGYDYVSGVNKRTANTVEFSVADRNREIHWFAIGF